RGAPRRARRGRGRRRGRCPATRGGAPPATGADAEPAYPRALTSSTAPDSTVNVPETVRLSVPPWAIVTGEAPALIVTFVAVSVDGSRLFDSAYTSPAITSSLLVSPAPLFRSMRSNRYWPRYWAAPVTLPAPANSTRPEPSIDCTWNEPSVVPVEPTSAIQ